ncbi:MAG: tRNA isopentenyl-2-thiomethyl-A-37 hydroxylase MiaE, partial [Planctomycetota bacterium]
AALGFLFRYPEHLVLQAPLSELAREELEHFERTLALLEGRGIPFGRQQPGPYAARLLRVVRPADPERLLDHMLCCAVIEARSCERMKVLSDALRGRDDQLADFYHDLVVSEARHHGLYVRLAKELFDPTEVQARLDEILDHEGGVMREATGMARLHD